jgi:hypothetical protein
VDRAERAMQRAKQVLSQRQLDRKDAARTAAALQRAISRIRIARKREP